MPIELICGCMFSGKTTELIRRVRRCPPAARVVSLKPAIDTRYSTSDIVSHDGVALAADVVATARDIPQAAAGADVVAIDEIHFFDDAVVAVCRALSAGGARVICCGLDRDMWGVAFPHIAALSTHAEVTVLHGSCRACGGLADRTQRTRPLVDDNLVGGKEAFEPRCQRCFSPPSAPRPDGSVPGVAGPGPVS